MQSYPFTSQVTYDDEGMPLYDRAVDSAFLRKVFAQYFSNGVFYKPTNALQVVAGTGMQIKVHPGVCHIEGAIGIEENERTLVVQAAESLDRIDTVVARLDLALAVRSIELYIVKGQAAINPQPPALTRDATTWELGLANLRIAKNASAISQQYITDTRLDTARCGMVAQTIGALDTEPYYAQLAAMIEDLQAVINGIEAGSEVLLKVAYGGSEDGVVKAADKLHIPRKIGLANFDGTADITVDQIGAMPKTGGSFSGPVSVNDNFSAQNLTIEGLSKLGVTRFFSPSYPNLGLTAVGDTNGGIYLGVCDANGAYKTFGLNAKLNAAGNISIRYKGGAGSSSGSSCRFAFGSKVLTPAEGSYAATLFTSDSLNSLFNTSGEAFSHYNTAVFGVNADYKYNDLRFFIACGTDADADTWVIRGQSTVEQLPNKPVRVNYLVVTWL